MMAKELYFPLESSGQFYTKKAKEIYFPLLINGQYLSKKVKKAYLSVNGYSKLFWDGGGGGSIVGFWFYYSTIVEKIIDGKQYTVVPIQIPVEVQKKNTGIAFYFFIQQIEAGSIIENLVFTVSTDSTATPFNGIWGGQTYPYDSVDSTTVNNDTWYYTIGAPFDYDYAPQYPADISPNCIVKDADLEELYDVEDMVKGFLNRYVYANFFTEDYQLNSSYDMNIEDMEKTLLRTVAIFFFKAVQYKNTQSYRVMLANFRSAISYIISQKGSYNILNVICTHDNVGTEIIGTFATGSVLQVTPWYKTTSNGYSYYYTNTNLSDVKRVRTWTNNVDTQLHTSLHTQSVTSSLSVGVIVNSRSGEIFVNCRNVGIKL